VVNPTEAAVVREIFSTFLRLRSVTAVMHAVNAQGYQTKAFTSRRGRAHPARPWCKAYVRRVLTNALYRGVVVTGGQTYPGQHAAIIEDAVWESAQALLPDATRTDARSQSVGHRQVALLRGVLRCGRCGCAMSPSSSRKDHRAYRYYVCSTAQRHGDQTCAVRTIPARTVEAAVLTQLRALMQQPDQLLAQLDDTTAPAQRYAVLCALQHLDRIWGSIRRCSKLMPYLLSAVIVYPDHLELEMNVDALPTVLQASWLAGD